MNQPKELLDLFNSFQFTNNQLTSQIARGSKFDEFSKKFLEKPQQIDEILLELVTKIIQNIHSQIINQTLINIDFFMFLFSILQLRGNQIIQPYFPNEIILIEKLLNFFPLIDSFNYSELTQLQTSEMTSTGLNFDVNQNLSPEFIKTQIQYVVLIYLNVLSMTPLNLYSIGDFTVQIHQILTENFSLGNKISQISTEVFARFSTRPDLVQVFGKQQFEFYKNFIEKQKKSSSTLISAFQFLNYSIKFVQDQFYQFLTFPDIENLLELFNCKNILLTKIILIFCSALGQKLLPKTYRNLAVSAIEELDGFDVSLEFDKIINILLLQLSSEFQEIRQISAIQLTNLTRKLPRLFIQEVYSAVVDLYQPGETPETQSGAVLCLGEMLRTDLIPEGEQEILVKSIIQGLRFSCKNSNAVKDSCCFCLWSLARDQNAVILPEIQGNLLAVSCFDSEILVRRAAAAAYQEISGRHNDAFKEGVRTSSLLDYYSLGNIANSYNTASKIVSLVPEIESILVDYLVNIYSYTNNVEQRQLAGKIFSQLQFSEYKDYILQIFMASDDWVEICQCLELLQYFTLDIDFYVNIEKVDGFIDKSNINSRLQFIDIVSIILRKQIVLYKNEDLFNFCIKFIQSNIDFYITQSFSNISVTSFQDSFSGELIQLGRCLSLNNFDFEDLQLTNIVYLQYQDKTFIQQQKEQFFEFLFSIMRKYKEAQNYVQRIFALELIDYYNEQFELNDLDSILIIINLALGDYSNDSRGDIGAQVRTKAYLTLAQINEKHQNFNLQNAYFLSFIEFMHSRIQFLRLTAAKRFYYDLKNNFIQTPDFTLEDLNTFTSLHSLENQKSEFFDINSADDDQIKLLLNQADYQIISNGFDLTYTLFHTNHASHILECLIFCYGNAPPSDELNMMKIVKKYTPEEIFTTCTIILQKSPKISFFQQQQLAATQLMSQLVWQIEMPSDQQILDVLPLFFAILKVKQVQLKHVQCLCILLSYFARFGGEAIQKRCIRALVLMTGSKQARNREFAVSGLIGCVETSILEQLCGFDWLESSFEQCLNYRTETAEILGVQLE